MFRMFANMFPGKAEFTEESANVNAGGNGAFEVSATETVTILQAINAHVRWKRSLYNYVNGDSGEIDHSNISREDSCHLGQWVQGIGAKNYGEFEAFQSLRSNHAAFHLCAGKVVSLVDAGKKSEAEAALHGEFVRISKSVVNDLLRINTAFDAKGHGKGAYPDAKV